LREYMMVQFLFGVVIGILFREEILQLVEEVKVIIS
jgi:hypothetical protein